MLASNSSIFIRNFSCYEMLGAVFKINRRSAYALRVKGKPRRACVTLGGTSRWLASTSAALAEHGFPLT